MGLFGDKSKKSWQRLSFGKKQTRAGILAKEVSRSQRAARLALTGGFALIATAAVASCLPVASVSWSAWLSVAGIVLVVHLAMLLIVRAYHRHVFDSLPTYLTVLGLFLVTARIMLELGAPGFVIPLPGFAIVIALVYGGPLAIHSGLACSVLLGLMLAVQGGDSADSAPQAILSLPAGVVLAQFIGSIVAVLGVSRLRTRTRLVTVGFTSGMAQAAAIGIYSLCGAESFDPTWDLFLGGTWLESLKAPGYGFLSGMVSGILITSLLPFLERWLDLTTDMRLLELADQNRPLLREMSLLAPGSFQHSLMVGQLAEEAAQSIGANDLLARVGALYHDIGKMLKPNYFVENNSDTEENIHDRLSPEMSRLIIIAHVKDGIRIAEEERLPGPIVQMIPMHHGTSVVEYFFHKKRKQEEEKGLGATGDEAFQYPGPKPTFKEAGILMIADTVEAISRVVDNPSRARLRGIVRDVIGKKMSSGQLDDCELTVNDLHRIEDAFVRVLASINHGRIKYPDQKAVDTKGDAPASQDAEGSEPSGDKKRSGGRANGKNGKNGQDRDKPDNTNGPRPSEPEKTR